MKAQRAKEGVERTNHQETSIGNSQLNPFLNPILIFCVAVYGVNSIRRRNARMIRLRSSKLNSGNSNATLGFEVAVMGETKVIPGGPSLRAIKVVKPLGERTGFISRILPPQTKLDVSRMTCGSAPELPMNGFLPFLSVLRPQLT